VSSSWRENRHRWLATASVDACFANCNYYEKRHQNEAVLAENLDGLHKDYNYKLCKIAFGKDEVAGSNPAISSIETVRNGGFSYAFWRNMNSQASALANF